jgi:hypothetical protein
MIWRPMWEKRQCGTWTGTAGPDELARPHASAFVVGNDAPLIGARAATRGRVARKVAMSAPILEAAKARASPSLHHSYWTFGGFTSTELPHWAQKKWRTSFMPGGAA